MCRLSKIVALRRLILTRFNTRLGCLFFLGLCRALTLAGADEPTVSGKTDQPCGITARVPWTTSHVSGSPDPPPPYRTERVFPGISFQNPVVIALAPGTDRWFIGEQHGKVFSFRNDAGSARPELFLDAGELLKKEPPGSPVKSLEALYGLTFHPRFAENRCCYVCYVVRGEDNTKQLPEGTRVSRFTVTETDPPRADLGSERVIITWLQGGHNGGCLKFGPDGYLYISTGDGSSAFPPDGLNAGQDVTNLLSSVLRIDVDHPSDKSAYSIPADNPLADVPGARREIWCYGLRNPWKMSFDRTTGDLWIGDVGWELWELVYRAERGGNFGWSIVEGPQSVHVDRQVGPTPILPPALAIPHTDGVSVTGGFVYRGKRFPELVGQYVFGDWETRRIWSAKWDGKQLVDRRDLVEPTIRVVDFAEDHAGELYVLDYDDGTLHALAAHSSRDDDRKFPQTLSETGIFTDTASHTPAPGVIPFSVNAPQWSDYASAERFVAIPGEGTIKIWPAKRNVPGSMFQTSMTFPVDSVLAKTFSLEMESGNPASRRRIETQLLHFDGKFWRAYCYAWDDQQHDAKLLDAAGTSREITVVDATAPGGKRKYNWRFSSRVECARCHNQWAEYTLAFNLRQLNKDHPYDHVHANQLRTFEHIGLIAFERPANESARGDRLLPQKYADHRLTDPYDESADLNERARSYLHINCAHCHRNGGGGTAYIELQQEITLDATKALSVKPTQGTFDIPGAEILSPGDPYQSVLFYRMCKTGSGRMPHLGSEMVDERGIKLIYDWIGQLPQRTNQNSQIERLIALDERAVKERQEMIEQLLSNPSLALALVRALDDKRLPATTREHVITAAVARGQPQIRDLFERFLPPQLRVPRLGPAPDAAQLLACPGDATRGRELFFNAAGIQCKTCHQIGGIGGKVGPDLSQIGKKYPPPQLLETIISPSKTVEPKFQNHLIATTEGRVVTGIIVERSDQELVLRDAKDQEIRLPAAEIEVIKPQGQSLMPEQLFRDLTLQQAADLLAFLESLR